MTDQNPLGEALPDPYSHITGWKAAFIDGRWRVGMAGNLDTIHDAVININPGPLASEGEAERVALWIARQYNDALRRAHRPVEQEAVAWRVHDWADDWILFHDLKAAERECRDDERTVQPLYAASPPSRALSQDEREAISDTAFFLKNWGTVRATELATTLLNILQPEGEANG